MTDVFKLIEANGLTLHGDIEHFAELVRADEREALTHYFNEHWRSDWSDGQIIEAIEARGNT